LIGCDLGFTTYQLLHSTSVLCIRQSWWRIISAIQHFSVHRLLKRKGQSLMSWCCNNCTTV